jgi:threonine dehydrogenase-like Zn-dependent dehydrogenase
MVHTVRAAVLTGPGWLEVQEFPRPVIGPDEGLLRIERCGICGSDVEQFHMSGRPRPVSIPGHEPLGVIEEVGERAAERWGVGPGDRVAVEIVVPCRNCELCITGQYMACRNKPAMYGGGTPISKEPAIWGGFAEFMYLHPNVILHKVRKDIDPDLAVMFNPLGAGVRWACHLGGAKLGDSVLILGPGQRGLAAVIAAKASGASPIIVTGLRKDAHKLKLAIELGADHVIDVEEENTVERVRELTGGAGADVVLDVTPMSMGPVHDAFDAVRFGGRVVLAGLKGSNTMEFSSSMLISKGITVVGAYSVDAEAYSEAISIIESGRFPLEKLHTHTFGLQDAALAIQTLAGEIEGENAVHVAINPGANRS